MPPSRNKSAFPWVGVLSLLVLINLAAGAWLSPITAVRTLRIEGVSEAQKGTFVRYAQLLKGRPALNVNPRELESTIMKDPAVENVDFRRSPFGSAKIRVFFRLPIARITGGGGTVLSSDGVLYKVDTQSLSLPVIELHPSSLAPTLTLLGPLPGRNIARLIQGLPPKLSKKGLKVIVDSEGAVCLNITQAARIVWGSADRLEEKLKALESLLSERPNLLENVKELNLTEPSRPAFKPLGGTQP